MAHNFTHQLPLAKLLSAAFALFAIGYLVFDYHSSGKQGEGVSYSKDKYLESTHSKSNNLERELSLLKELVQAQNDTIASLKTESDELRALIRETNNEISKLGGNEEFTADVEFQEVPANSADINTDISVAKNANSIDEFSYLPEDPFNSGLIYEQLNYEFLNTDSLLGVYISNVDCRGESCIVDVSQPPANATEEELFEFEFHLLTTLAKVGLNTGSFVRGDTSSGEISIRILSKM